MCSRCTGSSCNLDNISSLPNTGDVQGEIVESLSGSPDPHVEHDSVLSGHMIQAVFSMLWSTVVMELWKRRSSILSYRWGTMHLAEHFAEPRPGFHGNVGVNPVTGRVEPLFPEWRRDLIFALVSVPVVGLFLGTLLTPYYKSITIYTLLSWMMSHLHPQGWW